MKKVLIALDYSDATSQVAEAGVKLASSVGAGIILLHVLAEPSYYSSLNYSPILGFDSFSKMDILQFNVIERVKDAAFEFLLRIKENLDLDDAEIIVGEGDFAEVILDVADEKNVDLIAVGKQSRKGLDKFFVGSVAEKVMRKSDKPVYIIPIDKR